MNLNYFFTDSEFYYLTKDILEEKEFLKLKDITHHGMSRYCHSIRVAKASYEITKYLHLDYKKAGRAALLHDFFLEDNDKSDSKTRLKTLFHHPEYALKKASEHFELSDMEKDIIVTHMFPLGKHIPKYLESWIVDLVDDAVAVYEKAYGIRKQISFAGTFLFFLATNRLK